MKYAVDFSYTIPEWATIEVEANSDDDAKDLALENFESAFPEAQDVEITGVTDIGE